MPNIDSGLSATVRGGPGFNRPDEFVIRLVRLGVFALALHVMGCGLHLWGAKEFRDDMGTVLFLTILGVFCLHQVQVRIFPFFGLSYRDDALERRNSAALAACCGAWLSVAIIYTGGNLGEGPSYSENVFSAGLALAGWLVLWSVLEAGGHVSMSIAEERDLASGLRLGSYLLASGLVLGRAVAGDWHSVDATLNDFFRDGWFATILCAFALLVERSTKPSRNRPFPPWPSHGLIPALLYLALGVAWVWHLGPWEGMRR